MPNVYLRGIEIETKRNKIERWRKKQSTNYKVTDRRTKFSIPIVDHCSMIRENNTCVCILCVYGNRPDTHMHARTYSHLFCYWHLLSFTAVHSNYFDVFILSVCIFVHVHLLQTHSSLPRMTVFALQKFVCSLLLIYGSKRSAHFIWELKQQNPSTSYFIILLFLIRWTEAIFFLIHITDIVDVAELHFHSIGLFQIAAFLSLNIWSLLPVSVLFHFNKPSIWPVLLRARSLTSTKQINHHVWFTLLQTEETTNRSFE